MKIAQTKIELYENARAKWVAAGNDLADARTRLNEAAKIMEARSQEMLAELQAQVAARERK